MTSPASRGGEQQAAGRQDPGVAGAEHRVIGPGVREKLGRDRQLAGEVGVEPPPPCVEDRAEPLTVERFGGSTDGVDLVAASPGPGSELQMRVSAPARGGDLPVVIFSHGARESMDAYSPLAEFWATHGFAVIQPTHLDSQTLGIAADDPRTPDIWRLRVQELQLTLDALDVLEASVPGLEGRLDRDRIAVAGHSSGATTASVLLGARVLDDHGVPGEDMTDPRVRAGVLLAVAGTGGENLTPFAAEHLPFMNTGFATMAPQPSSSPATATNHRSVRAAQTGGTDAYELSPGEKSILTLCGAEHSMGGIAGFSVHHTADWSFDRIEFVQRVTTACLRSALDLDGEVWPQTQTALSDGSHPLGRLQSR